MGHLTSLGGIPSVGVSVSLLTNGQRCANVKSLGHQTFVVLRCAGTVWNIGRKGVLRNAH